MKLIPLSKWPLIHHWPSENTLRTWYARNFLNFRTDVTIRSPGRKGRILIKEDAFFAWIEAHRADADADESGESRGDAA